MIMITVVCGMFFNTFDGCGSEEAGHGHVMNGIIAFQSTGP